MFFSCFSGFLSVLANPNPNITSIKRQISRHNDDLSSLRTINIAFSDDLAGATKEKRLVSLISGGFSFGEDRGGGFVISERHQRRDDDTYSRENE